MHHWDADGIASAGLLLKHVYPGYENWTPNRGIRRLDLDHIEWLVDFDHIVITDMAIPRENIEAILESSNVTIIDHHLQKQIDGTEFINPIASGENPLDYPTTSWVIKEHYDLRVSLLVVIGLIGDRLQKADENPEIWRQVTEYMKEAGLTHEELYEMTMVVDSLNKMGDIDAVVEAPRQLQTEKPETIQGNTRWQNYYTVLKMELDRIYAEPLTIENGVIYKELDTKLNIVSDVAKNLAWNNNKDTITVNRGYFDDKDQIYIRSTRIDFTQTLDELRTQGYYATGKPGVLGAVIPASESDRFIEKMMQILATL